MKSLFVMLMSGLLLSGLGFAQTTTVNQSPTVTGGIATTVRTISMNDVPAKRCAFDFRPQSLPGEGRTKPPSPKETFNQSTSDVTTAFAVMHYHQSCPYERAIELFGQDRVRFDDNMIVRGTCETAATCLDYRIKRILVDDEEVYREQIK
jgi:hypothetical protein